MAEAVFTSTPISPDGCLDKPIWRQAPAYELNLSKDKQAEGQHLHEKAQVRFAWDSEHFYLGATLEDSDVLQEDNRDQQYHYQTGDVLELFLKPVDQTYYWELYVTPNGLKTSLFFPGRGRLGLRSALAYQCGLRVAARVDGQLNDWHTRDRGWSAEMALPLRDLEAQGVPLRPGVPWKVFIGRYNYSRFLPNVELSMYPAVSKTNYHLHEEWDLLHLRQA